MAPPTIAPEHAEVNRVVAEIGIPAAGNRLGVAAILYTYRCTIGCGHCCFGCCGARRARARLYPGGNAFFDWPFVQPETLPAPMRTDRVAKSQAKRFRQRGHRATDHFEARS